MADNVTYANFEAGKDMVVTSALWQYDYGQILEIGGIELPQAFEAQFCNRGDTQTVSQIGGNNAVYIPDQFLLKPDWIDCFIYLHTGTDDGETVYKISIPVRTRQEPSDIQPTPVQQDVITETIAALNEAVDSVPASINAALAEAKASGEFDGPKGDPGNAIWTTEHEPGEYYGGFLPIYYYPRDFLIGRDSDVQIGDIIFSSEDNVYAVYWAGINPDIGDVCYVGLVGNIKGDTGADGNCIWWTNTAVNKDPAIAPNCLTGRSTLHGRTGVTPAVDDLVYAPPANSGSGSPTYLYRIKQVQSSNVVMLEIGSLRGAIGATGADGADGNSIWTVNGNPGTYGTGLFPESYYLPSNLMGRDNVSAQAGDLIVSDNGIAYIADRIEYTEELGDIVIVSEQTRIEGEGVPEGGTAGQILKKSSATDYDTEWADLPTVDSALSDSSTNPVQNKVIKDELGKKADLDGSYQQLTAGNAEQLVSTIAEEDSVPYNFRTSGGSIDIGDREVDKIVGGTVAWNQLLNNGDFADGTTGWSAGSNATISASNGVLTAVPINLETSGNRYFGKYSQSYLVGHKYLCLVKTSGGKCVLQLLKQNPWGIAAQKTFTTTSTMAEYGTVFSPQIDADSAILSFDGYDELNVDYIMHFDLTQMFGSTIADYIYTLETSTPGAGVAWFRKLFPKPYYAYDAGSLQSVKTNLHKMVGFNAWDEEWELGTINTSGQKIPDNSYIRSKNYIPVVPGTQYFLKTGSSLNRIFYYDADKAFISFGYSSNASGKVYTTPANCHYALFRPENTYGTTYNHDICINLSWDGSRDGEYEPYEAHEYALDDVELRGIPKLDADSRLYYDGDTYESDGTVTRRYGIVTFDGSSDENWAYRSSDVKNEFWSPNLDNCLIINSSNQTKAVGTLNNRYPSTTWAIYNIQGHDKMASLIYGLSKVTIRDNAYDNNLEGFKSYLASNPMTVVYELATPTTETADPYQNPQIVNDFGTEEYVDAAATAATPTRDVAIPVGHDTKYQANLRAKLEMAPDSPESNGDYIVRHANGQNAYVPITFPADELPAAPTTDGNYVLKCTVSSGTATFTWEAQT